MPRAYSSSTVAGPRFADAPTPRRAESHAYPSAESFYFQKQMQKHTPLCVVLENGDSLTGTLEWFDETSIKLRCGNGSRVVIYKHGIRYLYKAE